MKDFDISARIHVYAYDELADVDRQLVDKAKEAAMKAYTPYSKFNVGAALLLGNGQIVTGNNQENAAYPSGLCAERTTLFYANAQYPDEPVDTMAIAAYTNGDYTRECITPCGACRQVILESQNRFGKPIRLILYGKKEVYVIDKVTDILPLSFGSEQLYSQQ